MGHGVPDEEVDADALERFSSSDTMLMGRVTYESFAAIWPAMTGEFADRVNSIRKYVFSSTLEKADWDNSTIVRGRRHGRGDQAQAAGRR